MILWTSVLFLFPLLLVQGMWIRKSIRRLPDGMPPDEGRTGEGDREIRIIGVGDSVIAGVGVKHMSGSLTASVARLLAEKSGRTVLWAARGNNGDKVSDLIARIPDIGWEPVDLVVVSVGVNDVSGLTSLARWQRRIGELIAVLKRHFSAPVVFLGLPPMGKFSGLPQPLRFALGVRASMLDFLLRQAALVNHDVYWSDSQSVFDETHVADDGYHPNEEACRIGARQIIRVLEDRNVLNRPGPVRSRPGKAGCVQDRREGGRA